MCAGFHREKSAWPSKPRRHSTTRKCNRTGLLTTVNTAIPSRRCTWCCAYAVACRWWWCCLLVFDSVTSTPQCIRQPRPRIFVKTLTGKTMTLNWGGVLQHHRHGGIANPLLAGVQHHDRPWKRFANFPAIWNWSETHHNIFLFWCKFFTWEMYILREVIHPPIPPTHPILPPFKYQIYPKPSSVFATHP
jgi:hypothetical protein